MDRKKAYIAVFDSGVGGISVLKELVKLMPEENYLYFGDSANAPYGTRPTEHVRKLTLEAARQLVQRGIKALVVACNTATSAAIEILRQTYPDLIIVGIEPALKPAADQFPQGNIGVMATQVTLREKKLSDLMARYGENCVISRIEAPGLVELVEQGLGDQPQTQALLEPILMPYRGKLDALVLGCTHYPFVTRNIAAIMGPDTVLLHGGKGTARETKRRLEKRDLLRQGTGTVTILNSADDSKMLRLSQALLDGEKVSFED